MFTVVSKVGENLYNVHDSRDNTTEAVSKEIIYAVMKKGHKIKGVTSDGFIFPFNTDRAPYVGTSTDLKYPYSVIVENGTRRYKAVCFPKDGKATELNLEESHYSILAWNNGENYLIHKDSLGSFRILGRCLFLTQPGYCAFQNLFLPLDRLAHRASDLIVDYIETNCKNIIDYGSEHDGFLEYRYGYYRYSSDYQAVIPYKLRYGSNKIVDITENSTWINPSFQVSPASSFKDKLLNPDVIRESGTESIRKCLSLCQAEHVYLRVDNNYNSMNNPLSRIYGVNLPQDGDWNDQYKGIPIGVVTRPDGIYIKVRINEEMTPHCKNKNALYELEQIYNEYTSTGSTVILDQFIYCNGNIIKIQTLDKIYEFDMDCVFAVYKKKSEVSFNLKKEIVTKRLLNKTFDVELHGNGNLISLVTDTASTTIPEDAKVLKTHSVHIQDIVSDISIKIPSTVEVVEPDVFTLSFGKIKYEDKKNIKIELNIQCLGVDNIRHILTNINMVRHYGSYCHVACTEANVIDVILAYFYCYNGCVGNSDRNNLNLCSERKTDKEGMVSDIPLNFMLEADVAKAITEAALREVKDFNVLREFKKIKVPRKRIREYEDGGSRYLDLEDISYLAKYYSFIPNFEKFLEIMRDENLGGSYQIFFNLTLDKLQTAINQLTNYIAEYYGMYLSI